MIVFVDGDTPCRVSQRRATKTWLKSVAELHGCALRDVSIVSCSDAFLLKYNREYLDHDTLTDIITFDNSDGHQLSGDLLISFPRVYENAENHGVKFENELRRVMAHGLLHLVGFKDKDPKDQALMRAAEDQALQMFHVEQSD